ncbi:MAG: ATP-binding protein [Polaromonas sp.]|uniref:ATP-binding protein n=1 Tax=Polaromonas sp. TaxID=1869339 RepID=UPI0027353F10|nr:ATP-binding protein [Polaromonas sp.]MDP2818500.1 ATP-binding protein [Polaromonas sp.]
MPVLTQRDVWLPEASQKAIAVIGMRRAGKTSLLWQIMAQQLAQGVPREALVYFSFEDERLAGMTALDLQGVVEEYYKLHPERRDSQKTIFFLDEIQLVPGWETFVRRILDTETIGIYLSGSSAKLLSREIATSMRGRALEAIVTPFSFREMLRHHGVLPTQPSRHWTKAQRSASHHQLVQYLAVGGFPEAQSLLAPQHTRQRLELLKTYVDVVLLRDVIERHNVTQPQVLRWLVQQLLGNAAGAFSVNRFFNDLKSRGIAVGKERLHEYLAHLEDTFLVTSIHIASESERRRQVNPRKSYPVDTGLSALFDPAGKPNTGHALETVVLHECLRRGAQLAYVRTTQGYEVDFLATRYDGQQTLIQVCADINNPDTFSRETRALQAAQLEHPTAQCLLITMEPPLREKLVDGVTIVLAMDWLLDSPS